MNNPLDPIWENYQTSLAALKVVRRCVTVAGVDRAKAFGNTRFFGLSDADCLTLLDDSQAELDDDVILSLYAVFEAKLRDHVVGAGALLHGAVQPNADFGVALAEAFRSMWARHRMDEVADLYRTVVGDALLAQVGNIRTYRHWIAHGRSWPSPPTVQPLFAYTTLTTFLQSSGLV